ncbi:MAG: class I SAM-dependent methyltransferase [Pseudomonadota bacterium]
MTPALATPLRARSYYAQSRLEVTALVDPIAGRSFLDIGCGEGGLGRALKDAGSGPVVGIEVDPRAAAEAARYYDRVHTADVDSISPPFCAETFDHLVCADILEHLKDPWGVLARFRPVLKKNGTLVASIPNIGNVRTVTDLLQGRFDYLDWGIMDQSHLRFFTRGGIEKMLAGAGYTICDIRPKCDPNAEGIMDLWRQHDMHRRLRDLVILMGGGPFSPTDRHLEEMLVIQYLVVAQRSA